MFEKGIQKQVIHSVFRFPILKKKAAGLVRFQIQIFFRPTLQFPMESFFFLLEIILISVWIEVNCCFFFF